MCLIYLSLTPFKKNDKMTDKKKNLKRERRKKERKKMVCVYVLSKLLFKTFNIEKIEMLFFSLVSTYLKRWLYEEKNKVFLSYGVLLFVCYLF